MDLGLANATAVVVGGGRGMGLAAARCLADDGARVAVVGRTAGGARRGGRGPDRAAAVPMRSGWSPTSPTPQAVQRVFDEVERALGRRAQRARQRRRARARSGTFEDLTDDQWRQAVDEGVMGMVHCVRSALPLLRKAEWARIVNFSAHSTQRQSVILPAYTAAKAMVTSISKNLSLALAPDEIMVNVVSPGSIAFGVAGGLGRLGRRRRQRSLRADGRPSTSTSGTRRTCRAPACPTRSGPSSRFWPRGATPT